MYIDSIVIDFHVKCDRIIIILSGFNLLLIKWHCVTKCSRYQCSRRMKKSRLGVFFCVVDIVSTRHILHRCFCGLNWIVHFIHSFTQNSFTLMCSLRPQVRALRSAYRHQSIPWLPVTLSATVAMLIVAFASVIVATQKSFGFALVVAVVNYPTLQALSMSFVHSLLQLELIHGPKHDCYSL